LKIKIKNWSKHKK